MFCKAQIKGVFLENEASNIGHYFSYDYVCSGKKTRKPYCDMNSGYMGLCEVGLGPVFVLGDPGATLFTEYDNDGLHQSLSANNPLLHAIPKQKPALKPGAMCQLALQRESREEGGRLPSRVLQ